MGDWLQIPPGHELMVDFDEDRERFLLRLSMRQGMDGTMNASLELDTTQMRQVKAMIDHHLEKFDG